MKAKMINTVLRKKINDLLESILDDAVREIVKNNIIVTGGCIASMLLREKVNDYDIYLRTRDAALKLTEYYVDLYRKSHPDTGIQIVGDEDPDRVKLRIPSKGVEGNIELKDDEESTPEELAEAEAAEKEMDKGNTKYRPVFFSANAITLSGKVQIIIRFHGEPEAIHENYDFVHCTNYWTSWDNKLILNKDALESLITKELRYVGSKYPLCSIIRLRKFIKRGWTINAGQILKMVMQANVIDLLDINVLEDQLTGVDALYFRGIISALKEGSTKEFDSTYVAKLVDKLF